MLTNWCPNILYDLCLSEHAYKLIAEDIFLFELFLFFEQLPFALFFQNYRLECPEDCEWTHIFIPFFTEGSFFVGTKAKIIQQFWTIFNEPRAELCWHKLWWGEDENAGTEFSQTMGLRIRLYRVVLNCSNNYFATLPRQGAVRRGQAFQVHLRKDWNRMAANARSAAKSIIVLNRFKT